MRFYRYSIKFILFGDLYNGVHALKLLRLQLNEEQYYVRTTGWQYWLFADFHIPQQQAEIHYSSLSSTCMENRKDEMMHLLCNMSSTALCRQRQRPQATSYCRGLNENSPPTHSIQITNQSNCVYLFSASFFISELHESGKTHVQHVTQDENGSLPAGSRRHSESSCCYASALSVVCCACEFIVLLWGIFGRQPDSVHATHRLRKSDCVEHNLQCIFFFSLFEAITTELFNVHRWRPAIANNKKRKENNINWR